MQKDDKPMEEKEAAEEETRTTNSGEVPKMIRRSLIFNTTKGVKYIHEQLKDGHSADGRLMTDLINSMINLVKDAITPVDGKKTKATLVNVERKA